MAKRNPICMAPTGEMREQRLSQPGKREEPQGDSHWARKWRMHLYRMGWDHGTNTGCAGKLALGSLKRGSSQPERTGRFCSQTSVCPGSGVLKPNLVSLCSGRKEAGLCLQSRRQPSWAGKNVWGSYCVQELAKPPLHTWNVSSLLKSLMETRVLSV